MHVILLIAAIGVVLILCGIWILQRDHRAPSRYSFLDTFRGRVTNSQALLLGFVLVGLGLALIFASAAYWFPGYYARS